MKNVCVLHRVVITVSVKKVFVLAKVAGQEIHATNQAATTTALATEHVPSGLDTTPLVNVNASLDLWEVIVPHQRNKCARARTSAMAMVYVSMGVVHVAMASADQIAVMQFVLTQLVPGLNVICHAV